MAKIYLVVRHERHEDKKFMYAFTKYTDALMSMQRWEENYKNQLAEQCETHGLNYAEEIEMHHEWVELQEIECL